MATTRVDPMMACSTAACGASSSSSMADATNLQYRISSSSRSSSSSSKAKGKAKINYELSPTVLDSEINFVEKEPDVVTPSRSSKGEGSSSYRKSEGSSSYSSPRRSSSFAKSPHRSSSFTTRLHRSSSFARAAAASAIRSPHSGKPKKPPAVYRIRIADEMDKDEYFETSVPRRRKWLERPLGKGVIAPFFVAYAHSKGLPRNAYALRRVSRCTLHGIDIPLDTPVRIAVFLARLVHEGDPKFGSEPIPVTLYLRADSGGGASGLLSMIRGLWSSQRHQPLTVMRPSEQSPMLAMATAKAHEHGWSERDSSVRGPDDETKDDEAKEEEEDPNAAMTMAFTQVRAGTVVATALTVDVTHMEQMITI